MKQTAFFSIFRANTWLVIILGAAFLLRVVCALYLGNSVTGLSGANDEISYSMLGQRFAAGYGLTFPDDWYPWIKANAQQSYYSATFSMFLGAIYAVFGYYPLAARLVMAALGTLAVLMTYLVARDFFGQRIALISAAIASVYAYLVFYSAALVTETPFIVCVLASIRIAFLIREKITPGRVLGLGAALALTVLLRMAVVFFIPILFVWLALAIKKRQMLFAIGVPIIMMALAVLPFTIHNYQLWERFMLLESQFGHVFWNGNHPSHLGYFSGNVFDIPPEILATNNDAEITTRLLGLGIANVMADPAHFLQLTLSRIVIFFTFWPTPGSDLAANLMRVFSFGMVFPLAVWGAFLTRYRWRNLLPIYLFMAAHTGVYVASWAMIRYRIPLDVFFIIFAALPIAKIFSGKRPSATAL